MFRLRVFREGAEHGMRGRVCSPFQLHSYGGSVSPPCPDRFIDYIAAFFAKTRK